MNRRLFAKTIASACAALACLPLVGMKKKEPSTTDLINEAGINALRRCKEMKPHGGRVPLQPPAKEKTWTYNEPVTYFLDADGLHWIDGKNCIFPLAAGATDKGYRR